MTTIHKPCRDSDLFGQSVRSQYVHAFSSKMLSPLLAMLALHRHEVALHSWRVSLLTETLACRLHFAEQEIVRLLLAARLHDVGKLVIPARLLDKPNSLTLQERTPMRTHPERGQQMLLHVGGMGKQLAPLVVAHHECWDGSGYPYGLKDNGIPQGARLLSVADAYDAMCSERPYRKSLEAWEVRMELQRGAGRQFDPQVCEMFLRMLDEEPNMFALFHRSTMTRTALPCQT